MICPRCGRDSKRGAACPCGYRRRETRRRGRGGAADASEGGGVRSRAILRWAMLLAGGAITIALLAVLAYHAYYRISDARFERKYETGEETPYILDQFTLADGRPAHAITLFGREGDIISIREVNQSYLVVG